MRSNFTMNRLPRECNKCGEKFIPDGPKCRLCLKCWTNANKFNKRKKKEEPIDL
jgi:hypothetical protein